jgi:hypothetical protein
MTSKEARERMLKEIQEIAEGWGKMISREAFPTGLDSMSPLPRWRSMPSRLPGLW